MIFLSGLLFGAILWLICDAVDKRQRRELDEWFKQRYGPRGRR